MEAVMLAVLVILAVLGDLILARIWLNFEIARLEAGKERAAGTAENQGDGGAEKRPDPIDEGFDNIMKYQVMGKTGFERDGE